MPVTTSSPARAHHCDLCRAPLTDARAFVLGRGSRFDIESYRVCRDCAKHASVVDLAALIERAIEDRLWAQITMLRGLHRQA